MISALSSRRSAIRLSTYGHTRQTVPPHRRLFMTCRSVSSAQLLHDVQSESQFSKQLEDPGFQFVGGSHMMLHDIVSQKMPMDTAATKVSSSQGVFLQSAPNAPDPGKAPVVRVQTLQGSGTQGVIDWAHHTFALSPFYCYSKSSIFTADSSMTPHLELEMGVYPGQTQVLLYINMDPKLSLTLHPTYLDRYYLTPPPTVSPGHTAAGSPTTKPSSTPASSSSSEQAADVTLDAADVTLDVPNATITAPGGSSWSEVEARAQGCAGFTRFTSPDLHVRTFSSTAVLFKVDQEGWPAARDILRDAVGIWLAWALSDKGVVDTPPGAATAAEAFTDQAGPPHTLPEDMAARSWAWRRFPRRERAAPMMKGVFGEQVMEHYWDSMAGEARIRL